MTERIIIGIDILNRGLLRNADKRNLKNSTYDLTIGEIVPVGRQNVLSRSRSNGGLDMYFIEPREMVFILSKEEFELPATVTGLASLRTTFTKEGLLALNVGFIDPFFKGPISTALLNFSDRPVEIRAGDKFFRVMFFEHADVSEFRPDIDESINKERYIRDLEKKAYSEFPQTYLNAPRLDDKFYRENFTLLVKQGALHTWVGRLILVAVAALIWQTYEDVFRFAKSFFPWVSAIFDTIKSN